MDNFGAIMTLSLLFFFLAALFFYWRTETLSGEKIRLEEERDFWRGFFVRQATVLKPGDACFFHSGPYQWKELVFEGWEVSSEDPKKLLAMVRVSGTTGKPTPAEVGVDSMLFRSESHPILKLLDSKPWRKWS